MRIPMFPVPYQSMFRPCLFYLEDMRAASGVDMKIYCSQSLTPLGTKRLYSATTATVNVAPYARRLWKPTPLVAMGPGMHIDAGRHVTCWIEGGGLTSRSVVLCGGAQDDERNWLLSASPDTVSIAPGEADEMSVLSGDWVSTIVTFRRGNLTYTDTSLGQRNADGMVTALIDANNMARRFSSLTGAMTVDLDEFTVRMKIEQSGYESRLVERHYVIDRTVRPSRRLAWINRFGAVDYHTFPLAAGFRSQGARSRVETSAGRRTAYTTARQSIRLQSEPCGEADAEWLSEIFSSPAVWMVEGKEFSEVEVEAGEVVCSPFQPTVVEVVISPVSQGFSRNF